MFNLFIALFGGLYYGGKYASEKSEIKAANKEAEALRITRENFESQYGATLEMEQQVKEYIMCGQHFEDICNSLAVELEDVLGEDWKRIVEIPNGYRVNLGAFYPHQHIYWVYHLLLSKKGKMDRWKMSMGHYISSVQTKERNCKFLHHIENNLRANNAPISLVFEDNGAMSSVKPDVMCIHSYHRLW